MALLLSIATAQAWTAGFSQPRAMAPRASAVSMAERTYIMIKPDGVQRGLVGTIIQRFEQRGYELKALKLYQASEELLNTCAAP